MSATATATVSSRTRTRGRRASPAKRHKPSPKPKSQVLQHLTADYSCVYCGEPSLASVRVSASPACSHLACVQCVARRTLQQELAHEILLQDAHEDLPGREPLLVPLVNTRWAPHTAAQDRADRARLAAPAHDAPEFLCPNRCAPDATLLPLAQAVQPAYQPQPLVYRTLGYLVDQQQQQQPTLNRYACRASPFCSHTSRSHAAFLRHWFCATDPTSPHDQHGFACPLCHAHITLRASAIAGVKKLADLENLAEVALSSHLSRECKRLPCPDLNCVTVGTLAQVRRCHTAHWHLRNLSKAADRAVLCLSALPVLPTDAQLQSRPIPEHPEGPMADRVTVQMLTRISTDARALATEYGLQQLPSPEDQQLAREDAEDEVRVARSSGSDAQDAQDAQDAEDLAEASRLVHRLRQSLRAEIEGSGAEIEGSGAHQHEVKAVREHKEGHAPPSPSSPPSPSPSHMSLSSDSDAEGEPGRQPVARRLNFDVSDSSDSGHSMDEADDED